MPLLNTADNVYLGGTLADKIYLGANRVWPPRSPSRISGLIRWGVAEDAVVSGTSFVSLNDRITGTAYVADTGGLVMGTLGGKPAITFAGSFASSLRDGVTGIPGSFSLYTVWAVATKTGGGGTSCIYGVDPISGTRGWQLGYTSTTVPKFTSFNTANSGNVDNGASLGTGVPAIHVGRAATSINDAINGNIGTSSVKSGNTRTLFGSPLLGRADSNNSAYFFAGQIAEWGIYSRALSDVELAQLDSYVQDRYGITVLDYAS
jgi:hypothetical protein